ncbi:MAG TPA: TolC family protein [Lacipirellulaceae bacterium]|jgi:outer membrane protein TolC|nr:TolC family protein [Lacipirellulaceae bacterium]
MVRFRKPLAWLLALAMTTPSGCLWQNDHSFQACAPPGAYEQVASEIEYPAETACTAAEADEFLASPQPWTISTGGTPEYWDISLAEVIQLALSNSRVLRDLGGAVVRTPGATRTAVDPAIAETDPRFGIEAALSEFDAQFLSSMYWEKNDRAFNNEFFGGGSTLVQQDLGIFQAGITKRAVTGSQFTIRHNVDYDANNSEGNLFDSAWNANVEMEFRHPFLQGSGVQFNRIAGPNNLPGFYDGVLIARLNADVALNDFEIAVRDLVSNVENAYWDLYFGYRVLDARVAARDASLDTWRKIYALYEVNRRGGEAEKEAQAREQFFRFQQDVQNTMSGEPYEQTRNWNGLPSGAFRTTGGVLFAERRLRLLMGMPPSDGRLMRPIDEPVIAKIDFDWDQVTSEATSRRVELRRQKFQIRRRELELIASKNYLLPRLDAVGRYRWRGFGDDLFNVNDPPLGRFDNAYSDLVSGDFQEWQLGFELSMPIGFRLAHVAARNAELVLARERALLRDQQREIVHEAADAIAEMDRLYVVLQSSYNRLVASQDQLGAVQAAYESDKAPLDLLLDAQRRRAEAVVDYTLNRARYAVATKNVHFVKGTLLEYDGIYLAEGPWPGEAYEDAAKREATRGAPRPLNYASSKSPRVSVGPYAQQVGESAELQESPVHPRLEEIHPREIREMAPPNGEQLLPTPTGDNLTAPETGAAAAPHPATPSAPSPAPAIPAVYVAPSDTVKPDAESTEAEGPILHLPPAAQP